MPVSRFLGLGAVLLAVVLAGAVTPASASAPTCQFSGTYPYCQYTGRVSMVYINEQNLILLYFDTPMDSSAPGSVGFSGVSYFSAAGYPLSNNPDFAKSLYASLLAAQARGANITVHMPAVVAAGYMKIDRIWVHE